jgi:LPXTG-motif cell wall-anchored protein
MRFCRVTVSWLLILAVLDLTGSAGALAAGPSAGDQQYIDPLSGSTTPSSHHSSPAASNSTPSGSSSASSTQGSTSPQASAVVSASTSATTTAAATTSQSSAATLPRTGFDAWLAAGLGLALLGTGGMLRRHQRRT